MCLNCPYLLFISYYQDLAPPSDQFSPLLIIRLQIIFIIKPTVNLASGAINNG
ncbi:Uncharacterised protein [Yersinia mollaretii]|nr:Uncharacterised protein [Yersinia mollaretii]CQR06162.1 Uncharacterised protein [Yersinia mollaretii]